MHKNVRTRVAKGLERARADQEIERRIMRSTTLRRVPKEVEKHKVDVFFDCVSSAMGEYNLVQIWFEIDEFKEAIYTKDNAKITDGREAVIERAARERGLMSSYNRERTQIGFMSYVVNDIKISNKVLAVFYKRAGREV